MAGPDTGLGGLLLWRQPGVERGGGDEHPEVAEVGAGRNCYARLPQRPDAPEVHLPPGVVLLLRPAARRMCRIAVDGESSVGAALGRRLRRLLTGGEVRRECRRLRVIGRAE